MTFDNIDLHFHAGHERDPETGIDDYLDFARMTGRRVLGVTDHFHYYADGKDTGPRPYPPTLDGFLSYLAEVVAARARFPELRIFICPEFTTLETATYPPAGVVAVSDYFLCEPPDMIPGRIEANTELLLDHVRNSVELRHSTGLPVILVHPFRLPVNRRLVKAPVDPGVIRWATDGRRTFSEEELCSFFMFDLRRFGEYCGREKVPIEVNGETDHRVRRVNLPGPLHMLGDAYRLFRDLDVDLVPGSDLHQIGSRIGRGGGYVPWPTLEGLGLHPDDSTFVRSITV